MKEALTFSSGVVCGISISFLGSSIYKYYKSQKIKKNNDIFTDKLNTEREHKFQNLITNQTHVNVLTTKELTGWFKKNREKVDKNAKMIIITPTEDNMRGLGYPRETNLDIETNIIQLFYDEESGNALLIRLVNFIDIDSNLQAKLIEQEGMIVVID